MGEAVGVLPMTGLFAGHAVDSKSWAESHTEVARSSTHSIRETPNLEEDLEAAIAASLSLAAADQDAELREALAASVDCAVQHGAVAEGLDERQNTEVPMTSVDGY